MPKLIVLLFLLLSIQPVTGVFAIEKKSVKTSEKILIEQLLSAARSSFRLKLG